MLKKLIRNLFILLFAAYHGHELIAQNSNSTVQELEHYADSLYYGKSDYYKQKHFQELYNLRKQILDYQIDSLSVNYRVSLSKKFASQALLCQFNLKLDSAVIYSEKAKRVYEEVTKKDLYYLGHLEKYLYQQYMHSDRVNKALESSLRVRKLFKDTLVYNHKLVAEAEFDYGFIHGRYGDYNKVIEQYKTAIALNISRDGEFKREVAIQEHHLAVVYGFIGYYKKELESYNRVINRWENIEDPDKSYLNVAYGSLVTWYIQHGDLKSAEKYITKNKSLIERNKNNIINWFNETYKGRTAVDISLKSALVAVKKKDTLKALNLLEKVLNFAKSFNPKDPSNNPNNLPYFKDFLDLAHMRALRQKADIIRLKNPLLAKQLYEKILMIEGDPVVATTTLRDKLNIVNYYISERDFFTAKSNIDSYLVVANEMNSDYSKLHLIAKKAGISGRQKQFEELDTLYDKAFKFLVKDTLQYVPLSQITHQDCKQYGDKSTIELVLNASNDFLNSYQETGMTAHLLKAHKLSVLASDMFSYNFSFLPYNGDSYEFITRINEQLLKTTMLLNDASIVGDILESIEQSSSRLSWKKFLAGKQRQNFNIPDSILDYENNLKSSLHFYKKAVFIDAETNPEKLDLFKEKIYDIEAEIERLEEWYYNNYPSYYNQTQRAFNVSAIKKNLKSNERIVKYVIAKDSIYTFLIAQNTTKLYSNGSTQLIVKKINELLKKFNPSSDSSDLAKVLNQQLLPLDIFTNHDIKKLIFVQDDILNFLPMELLIDSNNDYLIENYIVSYTPSLLLWEEQIKAKKSKYNRLGIFVPSYDSNLLDADSNQNHSLLLGAKEEAKIIGTIFKADIFSEEKATKQEFLDNAPNYSMLHLAMHSNINNANAEFSNLKFSTNDQEKLFISELYNLTLNADLAVLSACNTGSGKLNKGEGPINVSKAFTYAGVPSVVMSLWEVPDKETLLIMGSFYRYLKDGYSKDEALQLAKLKYLTEMDDLTLKNPYYWAGFVISGDPSPIANDKPVWLYAFIVLIFVSLVWLIIKRYLKKSNAIA